MANELNFPQLVPDLQVSFYFKLKEIRNVYLSQALREAVNKASLAEINAELQNNVSEVALKRVASFGLRGEILFPVPVLLRIDPLLLGYYRLLYGFSQKEFYKSPISRFRNMEDSGFVPDGVSKYVPDLCSSMIEAGEFLVENLDQISVNIIHELQLLTYGPQLRGSRNTMLGSVAEKEIKDVIRDILAETTVQEAVHSMKFTNSAGDAVQIIFAGDPDVSVFVTPAGEEAISHLSIEIKGGKDFSNIHNRLGEAEKSHIKAKEKGFSECWTIIAVELGVTEARRDSPTTDHFFYMEPVKDKSTTMYADFKRMFLEKVSLEESS